MTDVTQQGLRKILRYDLKTGVFTRKIATSNRIKVGDVAGCADKDGYLLIRIGKKLYKSHRLAWLYVHGRFPENDIDHINGIKADNRITNLRDVTCAENHKNMTMRKDNLSGVVGVCWAKREGKWRPRIQHNGREVYLGMYDDLELAALVRQQAELKYGYHANHGRSA